MTDSDPSKDALKEKEFKQFLCKKNNWEEAEFRNWTLRNKESLLHLNTLEAEKRVSAARPLLNFSLQQLV